MSEKSTLTEPPGHLTSKPRDPDPVESRSRGLSAFVKMFGLRRLNALYLLITFVVLFSILNPGVFLTDTTATVVFRSGVVVCILALAFLIPLTTGTYDLSIGAMMTFSLVITAKLSIVTSLSPLIIGVISVLCCAAIGSVSGFIVVKFHVNSFIATLGISQVLLAGSLLVSQNTQLVGEFPEYWSTIGNGEVLGVPNVLLLLLVLALIIWYFLEFTRLGRYLFATGGNRDAAKLSGVKTEQIVWSTLVLSAAISGFAGVVYSMQVGVANNTVGAGLLFPACTAVFLGAAQLSQRPNVWGTIIAYFALAFGIHGLRLTLGADAAWAGPMFEGLALIIAVAVASRPLKARLKNHKSKRELATTAGGDYA